MIQIDYGPQWFYLPSLIIDFIAFLVLSLISIYGFKYFKMSKKVNYLNLSRAFFLLCLSFLFKLLTNVTVYYDSIKDSYRDIAIVSTLETIRSFNILSILTFSAFVLLQLLGLYFLYNIYNKNNSTSHVFLMVYFVLLSTYLSNFDYYIFHLTALFLLGILSLIYLKNYKTSGYKNAKLLFYSFFILSLSQVFFITLSLSEYSYVIAEILQLIGYYVMLLVWIGFSKHGKKKK